MSGERSTRSPSLALESEHVAIYDDLLDEGAFGNLLAFANGTDYEIVHAQRWRKVWRLHDGLPLQGRTAFYWPSAAHNQGAALYPTGTPLDVFVEAVLALLPRAAGQVGHEGRDWQAMSVAPWVYPVGSGLSIHRDGGPYSGAFTYFLHPRWNVHWGGNLLVFDPRTDLTANPGLHPPWLSDEHENAAIWDPGLALCVPPKPNRLAFIAPDSVHMMTRVDPSAGQSARVTLAGFFLRDPERPAPG